MHAPAQSLSGGFELLTEIAELNCWRKLTEIGSGGLMPGLTVVPGLDPMGLSSASSLIGLETSFGTY